MKRNTEITIYEITNDRGYTQILAMTPQQHAGYMRRKGMKKRILTKKRLATLSINIKTFVK